MSGEVLVKVPKSLSDYTPSKVEGEEVKLKISHYGLFQH